MVLLPGDNVIPYRVNLRTIIKYIFNSFLFSESLLNTKLLNIYLIEVHERDNYAQMQ